MTSNMVNWINSPSLKRVRNMLDNVVASSRYRNALPIETLIRVPAPQERWGHGSLGAHSPCRAGAFRPLEGGMSDPFYRPLAG
jgi:hypothetical protein